jgi:membrane protein implicated in regulation of membrane protease activity
MDLLPKLIWLILLLAFAGAEALTVGLTSIWFAAGALVALVAALVNGPIWLQVALFLVVSVLCLIAVRPLAKKYLNPVLQPTNADRILGAEVRVTEEIDNLRGQGQVAVGAMPWTARSEDGAPIPAGALVRVLRIEGVKVYVEPVKEEVGAAK